MPFASDLPLWWCSSPCYQAFSHEAFYGLIFLLLGKENFHKLTQRLACTTMTRLDVVRGLLLCYRSDGAMLDILSYHLGRILLRKVHYLAPLTGSVFIYNDPITGGI